MDYIRPTPRKRLPGLLADTLQGINDFASKPFGYDNPPVEMLMGLLGVPAAARTLDRISYGEPLTTGKGMTLKPKADTVDAAFLAAPMVAKAPQAATAAARALGPKAADMAEQYMLQKGMASAIHLEHLPSKPNPLVGKRFEREFVGQMAEKKPVKIEDLKGSSLLAMPWDSTNRGYLIKSVSDEVLPAPVLTTGGQDFARDLAHVQQGIGGASNAGIAQRIQDRVRNAARENEMAGGTGDVYSLPVTMGEYAEDFSTMPTEVLLGLIQNANLKPDQVKYINELVRNAPVEKGGQTIRGLLEGFRGVDTDDGLLQFITGEGVNATAGDLRKAFTDRMRLKEVQKMLGYNHPDLVAAITDPALAGVPKGYAGNTVIKSDPKGVLTPSDHPSYDTNFAGRYTGSLLDNIPLEVLMPKSFNVLSREMSSRRGDLRNNVIGALEKRKQNISEIVDQQVIDSVNEWLTRRRQ